MWGDFWNALGNIGNFVEDVVPAVYGTYNLFNKPSGGGGGQMQMPMPQQPPMMPQFDMSGFNEMMAGFAEMMGAQQAAMIKEQQKGMARNAASTRKQLQTQGVYGEPGSTLGAAGVDSIASVMGVSPEELMKALQGYGSEFGFEV